MKKLLQTCINSSLYIMYIMLRCTEEGMLALSVGCGKGWSPRKKQSE